MRLRIQTLPPLPDLKAWFTPDACQVPKSILEFKGLLCSQIVMLKNTGITREDIQLLLDEFELLNESPYAAALRDGDLICIKARSVFEQSRKSKVEEKEEKGVNSRPSKKRKRAGESRDLGKRKRKSKIRKVNESDPEDSGDSASSSSSSSSSSSAESSSSSSSSTSSTSSSSSSTSEESDSSSFGTTSSSSPPSPRPSKHPAEKLRSSAIAVATHRASPKPIPLGFFVPPGQGKPTTHARNLRRKRLRAAQAEARALAALEQAQTAQTLASPPRGMSQSNAILLGQRAASQPARVDNGKGKGKEVGQLMSMDEDMQAEAGAVIEERREVMMASLGNKNKKKGYKQFLMGPVPKKIVFEERGETAVSGCGEVSGSGSAPVSPPLPQASTSKEQILTSTQFQFQAIPPSTSQQPLPRLIPPSEIQERGELPPNMFVTSVDVEADLWSSNGRKKNKGKKQKKAGTSREYDSAYDQSYNDDDGCQADADMTLPYGDEGHAEEAKVEAQSKSQSEPTAQVTTFDWINAEKSFDNAPKVTQLDDLQQAHITGWKSLDLNPQTFTPEILLIAARVLEVSFPTSTVKVQRLLRPVDPNLGVSGFLAPVDASDGDSVGEIEEYHWNDIQPSDWRILQTL